MAKSALIIVDVQNDFINGSLAVTDGQKAAWQIRHHLAQKFEAKRPYDAVVATKDFHIKPKSHFSDAPNFVDTWPPHCVVGTDGVDFPSIFYNREGYTDRVVSGVIDNVFYKGMYDAAYSSFESFAVNANSDGWDVAKNIDDGNTEANTSLLDYLLEQQIEQVVVVGIATDYCVRATALDAQRFGFDTTVDLTMCAAVSPDTAATTIKEWEAAGVHVTK